MKKDESGKKIFSHANRVTVSNNGKIYVTDKSNGLIALDRDGLVLWEYDGEPDGEPSDLYGARSVCVDGFGNVFVCGFFSDNVLEFGDDGERLGEVVSAKRHDISRRPQCVSFDRNNCRLIVTCLENDEIYIFTVSRGI